MDLDQIDTLTPDQLQEVIKRANQALDRQLGEGLKANRNRLSELINPESDNFMGSGLSMHEFLLCLDLDAISRSFVRQDLKERKRRLRYVIRLGAELERIIAKVGRFSTAFAEGAIEHVILGDWRAVKDYKGDLVFKMEGPEVEERYGPAYAVFRELLQEAFDTRPGTEQPPKQVH